MSTAFLEGKDIVLRGFEREDLQHLYRWVNDPEVTYYMFMGDRPSTIEDLAEIWEKERKSPTDIVFAIIEKAGGKVVGTCGLYCINFISRHAELRIVIGEKDFWGKGLGTETLRLMISYAFDKLNLNKVWLGGNADNTAAIRCYEKAGFTREGVLRQEIYRNGKYYDAIRLSILREEYEG
jgi:RimJ/RimL family protein N-acetyltransferase